MLRAIPDLTPVSVTIFGGVVDPARLRFPFSRMPATDARDWDAIGDWTDDVAEKLGVPETVPS